MSKTDPLRKHIISLLTKAEAHVDVQSTLRDFPAKLQGRKPEGSPHTAWELLEHMRIAQWDILQFSLDQKHKSPKWPDEYWPKTEAAPTEKAWAQSVRQFLEDLEGVCQMVNDSEIDLLAQIPHGEGQTYLREALLVADHNAYHLGQMVMVR